MAATVDTTDISYGAAAVANSRPAVYSGVSGTPLWYMVYAKAGGTYYATSPDGVTWTTHTALSGLAGRLLGALSYNGVRDIAGNLYYAYPGGHADGSMYMLYLDSGGWDATPPRLFTGYFGGAQAHLYEGASAYLRMLLTYGSPSIYRTTTPNGSSTTWVNDQAFTGAQDGTASSALLIQGTNIVALYWQNLGGVVTLRYTEFDLDTVPGSTEFPTCLDAISDDNLHKNFAACVDTDGIIHVIYRLEGTDWYEATYNGASWTTGGTVPQMTDDDRSPALMCDGAGKLHLVYARYNSASDYGIGYISKTSGGVWTAQSDIVAHDGTNRASVTISETTSTTAALVTWLNGTGSPYTIRAQSITVSPVGVNPLTAAATRTAVGPSSVSFSVVAGGGTSPYTYQWHRSLLAGFTPGGGTALSGGTSSTLTNTPPDNQIYYYKCVVTDNVATTQESNQLPGQLYASTLILGFIGDSITSQASGGDLKTCEVMGERLSIWQGIRTVVIEDQSHGGATTGLWQPGGTYYDDASAAFTSAGVNHVAVMLGTNGLSTTADFDQASMDAYLADIGAIVDQLVLDGFKVIINAPPYISLAAYEKSNAYLQAMSDQLPTLADGVDVFMGDHKAYTWFGQHPDELIDGVHPSILGVQALGSLWARAFENAVLAPTSAGGAARRSGFNAGFN